MGWDVMGCDDELSSLCLCVLFVLYVWFCLLEAEQVTMAIDEVENVAAHPTTSKSI